MRLEGGTLENGEGEGVRSDELCVWSSASSSPSTRPLA